MLRSTRREVLKQIKLSGTHQSNGGRARTAPTALPLRAMFNPRPTLTALPLFDGHEALVIDNALLDPARWVEVATQQRDRFEPPPWPYPGIEAPLPDDVSALLGEFFAAHARRRLGGRRTLSIKARLSLATRAPHELSARQWFCHRDSQSLVEGQCIAASVLYLFHDAGLGGTGFYKPRRSAHDTALLVHDASTLTDTEFARAHPDIAPGYMTEGNAWFERVAGVDARWNRIVFYDGSLFHSADLHHPERLAADPASGRLTVNGFFTCRRVAA